MPQLTTEHKRRMREGRIRKAAEKRAAKPIERAEIERKLDAAGLVYRAAKGLLDYQLMAETRQEIAVLGQRRRELQEGGSE